MDSRVAARSWIVVLVPMLIGGCGDDASDSAGELGSASAEDGPELTTSAAQTDGDDDGGDSDMSDSTTTSAGDSTGDDSGSDTSTSIGTDSGGTMVDACTDCSADELCVELTEYAGPADGGGPMVSYTCHPVPAACADTITCECAGFLCPGNGGGAEGMCNSDGEVLYCSIAYP